MKAVHKRNVTILALIVFLAVLAIEHKVKSEPNAVAVLQQTPDSKRLLLQCRKGISNMASMGQGRSR
jgi:hypothetical protein